jgi:hypothetical protein
LEKPNYPHRRKCAGGAAIGAHKSVVAQRASKVCVEWGNVVGDALVVGALVAVSDVGWGLRCGKVAHQVNKPE